MRWWRRRSSDDFAEEIRAHLVLEADAQRAAGVDAEEATYAARRAFGNVTTVRERHHDAQLAAWVDATWRHVRYAARGLLRRPGFASSAILTLAFGIGVNAALFTVIYSLLVRPLPIPDSERIARVTRDVGGEYGLMSSGDPSLLSWPDYQRLRRENTTLEQLAVHRRESLTLLAGDKVVAVPSQLVSCNFFVTLRIAMVHGRGFALDECASAGDDAVVVLAHGFWQREFGSDAAIVGRRIVLNRQPFTVIGIAAPGFSGIEFERAGLWLPVTSFPRLHPNRASDFMRDMSWLTALGRLRDGTTRDEARADLSAIARREDANWPGRSSTIRVTRATMLPPGDRRGEVTAVVSGVVALGVLALVMACANVMNLLLVRSAARRREIGIRLSLGASRRRLVAQLMVESALLSLLGGGVGLVLAYVLPPLIVLTAPVPVAEVNLDLAPDRWIMAGTALVAFAAALLVGLVPALQATDLQLTSAMRNDVATGRSRSVATRLRGGAVAVQVGASALLLVTAALFLRATQRSLSVNPGFATRGWVTLSFNVEQLGYDSTAERRFMSEMRRTLALTPGITSVGVTQFAPLKGEGRTRVVIDATVPDSLGTLPTLFNAVSGDYFATAGIALVRGRSFDERVVTESTSVPVVVSAAFARAAWGAGEAIGRSLQQFGRTLTVVGIARDVQSVSLGIDDGPYLYTPAYSNTLPGRLLAVRSDLPSASVRAIAERLARAQDASVLVTARGIEEGLAQAAAPIRLAGLFAGSLGGLALILAVIGVYGVVSFGVSQRAREIGIRMALGATRGSVRTLILREGARVVAVGLVAGLLGAAATSQALRSLLVGIAPLDAAAFATATVVLSVAACIAVTIPATRAARVDPVTSLRED